MESLLFWATIQMPKSGACGGPRLNIHEKTIFLSSRQAFCPQKKESTEIDRFKHHTFTQPKTKKKWRTYQRKTNGKNKTKFGPCLEASKDPPNLIWCILHTACTLFPGTDLE